MLNAVKLGRRNSKITNRTGVPYILIDMGVNMSPTTWLWRHMFICSTVVQWKVAEHIDAMPGRKSQNTILNDFHAFEYSLYVFLFVKLCSTEPTVMGNSVK